MRKLFSMTLAFGALLAACTPTPTLPDSVPLSPTTTFPPLAPTVYTTEAEVPTIAAVSPDDPCANPYYPIVDGAWWKYSLDDGKTPLHTMATSGDTFTLTVESEAFTAYIRGSCTDDGIVLLDVPGVAGVINSREGGANLTTTNDDGVTLPNDIQIGDDWSQTITAKASSPENEEVLSSTIDSQYKALGFETVATPLGPINALKVEQTATVSLNGRVLLDYHALIWYGQGIGPVRNQIEGISAAVLQSYNIPQPEN
jgi:hypothetical protein